MDKFKFLQNCAPQTQLVHEPLIWARFNPSRGLNPARLGYPLNLMGTTALSTGSAFGQSTITFNSVEAYLGLPNVSLGQATYGIVGHDYSVALAEEINKNCAGKGAVATPSGMAAITVALLTIHTELQRKSDKPAAILLPWDVYGPVKRLIEQGVMFSHDQVFYYGPSEESFEQAVVQAGKAGMAVGAVYIESPVSNSFEVYNLQFLTRRAKELGAITVMDNAFSSFFGCKPLRHGVDVVIEVGTKYLGGYGDCPFGAVVCKDPKRAEAMAWTSRVYGFGTIAPGLCELALYRMQSASDRMAQSFDTAQQIVKSLRPYQDRGVIDRIAFYDPSASENAKHKKTFKRGNGLFTILLSAKVSAAQRNQIINGLHLAMVGESWGGHVSLVLPRRDPNQRVGIRVSIGLEAAADLERDFQQSFAAVGLSL